MVKVSRIGLGLLITSALCLGFMLTLTNGTKAHAASTPGGVWVTPTTDNNVYEPGIWYTIKARAYSPAGIDHVNFTAGDPWNRWYVFCNPTQPDPGTVDTYSCQTDFRPPQTGVYFGGGTIHLSFDVYGKDGGINQAPNGERTEIYKNSRLGGTWNSPSDGATYKVGDHIRFSANAYPSDGGHPIDHVAFTAYYAGSWHTVCTQSYPNGHEFGCDWYPPANATGNISDSFDVYTTNPGETSYAPNGVHTLHIQALYSLGGTWINPGIDNITYEPGIWYTFQAHAFASGTAVDHVNFTAQNPQGNWYVLCSPSHPDIGTVDVYSCPTDFRPTGVYFGGGTIHLSFDVYGTNGAITKAPNGIRTENYKFMQMGGVWNTGAPSNNFTVNAGASLHLTALAYPADGGYPIDHVEFTATWPELNGSWTKICPRVGPGFNPREYACNWTPTSSVLGGQITISFDVYYTNGYRILAPNGTHTGTLVGPQPAFNNPTTSNSSAQAVRTTLSSTEPFFTVDDFYKLNDLVLQTHDILACAGDIGQAGEAVYQIPGAVVPVNMAQDCFGALDAIKSMIIKPAS